MAAVPVSPPSSPLPPAPTPPTLEQLHSLREAAGWLPRRRGGRKTHVSCLVRWIQRGVNGIRLAAWRVGGVWCTSREALAEFITALSAPAPSTAVPPPTLTPAQFEAREILERAGIRRPTPPAAGNAGKGA